MNRNPTVGDRIKITTTAKDAVKFDGMTATLTDVFEIGPFPFTARLDNECRQLLPLRPHEFEVIE